MNEVLEILKYTLPALITGGTAYLLIDRMLSRKEKNTLLQMRREGKKVTDPLRLQAIERLTLLMERISPASLVMRVPHQHLTSGQFHAELLRNIRNEYDHNITQQVYVSHQAWEAIKNAREETTKLINYAYSQLGNLEKGSDLAQIILEMTIKIDKLPTDVATFILREEAKQIY